MATPAASAANDSGAITRTAGRDGRGASPASIDICGAASNLPIATA